VQIPVRRGDDADRIRPVNSEWKAAIDADDAEAVTRLVEAGADIDALDQHGQTGVMIAARDGRTQVVRRLVELGADLDHRAKFNLSALMLAVINGRDAIVGILLDGGADATIRGTGAPGFAGKTALDIAEAADRVIMVALLRDAAADGRS
jgi:ankyrin repeat protein